MQWVHRRAPASRRFDGRRIAVPATAEFGDHRNVIVVELERVALRAKELQNFDGPSRR
jgi:hypothetical protein